MAVTDGRVVIVAGGAGVAEGGKLGAGVTVLASLKTVTTTTIGVGVITAARVDPTAWATKVGSAGEMV